MDDIVQKTINAKRESKAIEFKESFDVTSPGEWCEVIKDIIAIANSGGGTIVFGLGNNGEPSGSDVSAIISLDPADITNKIQKYTGYEFSYFDLHEHHKAGHNIAVLTIEGLPTPVVFIKPGTYDIGGGKQRSAFSTGTVYFRHGAKSEPGNTEDIRKIVEKQIDLMRKEWIRGVKRVVEAPRGSRLLVVPQDVYESTSDKATPIRIVDDPKAPAFRKVDTDTTYPYRQKEALQAINDRLGGAAILSTYDLLCLRRLHNLENNTRFCYKPKFSGLQYSEALVEWIVEQQLKDPHFIEHCRTQCYDKRYELGLVGKHKPKEK